MAVSEATYKLYGILVFTPFFAMYSPVVKIMQVKRLCPSAITIQVVRPLLAHLFYHTIPTLLTLPYSTEYYYILLKLFVASLGRVKSNGHFLTLSVFRPVFTTSFSSYLGSGIPHRKREINELDRRDDIER